MSKRGGSQSSAAVVGLVAPAAFPKLDSMFSDTVGGKKPRKKAPAKKKGGSQSSSAVSNMVSGSEFTKMNSMFSDAIGGNTNVVARNTNRKAFQNVDLNDTTDAKMMVYNKSGGKKKAAPKPRRKALKGGDATSTTSATSTTATPVAAPAAASDLQSWIAELPNVLNNIYGSSVPNTPLPPPHTAGTTNQLNTSAISASQKLLVTQPINTMSPMSKTTTIPANSTYKGTGFAFGGGKKKAPKKAAKKAPKKK